MRRLPLVILLFFSVLMASAQTRPLMRSLPEYGFAHFDRNHIQYPGDSLAMERFFQKMDSVVFLGQGNLNIIHIGGSHVQAGVFTQQFRDNLLEIAPDLIGGQYFVFPFSAGGTNNPSHYIVRYSGDWSYSRNAVRKETDKRMGLAGAAITTSDENASVSIISREKKATSRSPQFAFNKVTVIGFSDTDDTAPVVSIDGKTILGKYDEDLSTFTFTLPRFTDSVCICFDSVPGEFTITGILLENGMPGINVHGVGVNGASVPSYLRCDDFERDLELIKPDLIIFGIGINDASEKDFDKEIFKSNYAQLIEIMQRVNPDCALLFMSNNDSFKKLKKKKYQVNTNGLLVEIAVNEMGRKYNAGVWDQFDIMGGLKSMQKWQNANLAQKDKVHFTTAGYELMGDLLYNALIERYMEHLRLNAKKN